MTITAPAIPASGTLLLNPTGQQIALTVTGGTVTGVLVAPPAQNAPVIATPAVPASTVTATNTNNFPVAVAVTGGTVTAVAVNGSNQFTGTGVTAVVPAGGTIAITYTVAPTWAWSPLVAGAAGTLSSPQVIILPPGCGVTLIYSVVPTSWTWLNPICEGYTPGYYGTNSQSNVNYNTQIPYPPHAANGQVSLASAVSN